MEQLLFYVLDNVLLEDQWLVKRSLFALAGCNRAYRNLLVSRHSVWEPWLKITTNKYYQTGVVDTSNWTSPLIPSIVPGNDLRVPERMHGRSREPYSYYIHRHDTIARTLPPTFGLVKPRGPLDQYYCFDQVTGSLKDRFVNSIELNGVLEYRWVERPLPVECSKCGTSHGTYPAFVAHCMQWSHRQNYGPRVPDEFVDPRNLPDYERLTIFQKLNAMKKYTRMFISSLRLPMEPHAKAAMEMRRYRCECWLNRDIPDTDFIDACKQIVRDDFREHGLEKETLAVVVYGWSEFRQDNRNLIAILQLWWIHRFD